MNSRNQSSRSTAEVAEGEPKSRVKAPEAVTLSTVGSPIVTPRPTIGAIVERFGLLILVLVMVVLFSVLPSSGPAFRSVLNAQTLVANQGVGLVVAIALLFPLAAGYFDFSVGAVASACCLVTAACTANYGLPLWLGILLALAFGLAIGAGLGWMVAYMGINPFISTLGVATLLGGIIFAYTGGLQITKGIPRFLTTIGSGSIIGIPTIAIVATVIALLAWWLMSRTVFGRRLYAVGLNPRATQLIGVNVRRIQFLAFVASGGTAAIGGVLLLARQGAATSDSGMTMLFPALTAVLLGTIVIYIGRPSVPGTVVGLLFVAVLVSGLTLVGAPAWVGQVFNGAALLIAVAFARLARAQGGKSS